MRVEDWMMWKASAKPDFPDPRTWGSKGAKGL